MKAVDWYLTDKGITFAGTYDIWATSMIEAEASRRKGWEKESGMNNREDEKQNKLDKANNNRRKIAENPWAESRTENKALEEETWKINKDEGNMKLNDRVINGIYQTMEEKIRPRDSNEKEEETWKWPMSHE